MRDFDILKEQSSYQVTMYCGGNNYLKMTLSIRSFFAQIGFRGALYVTFFDFAARSFG